MIIFGSISVPSSISWSFGMEPAVMNFKKTQNTEIAWETPTSEQASGLKQAFVYILMAKEPVGNPRSRTWTEVTQVYRERERPVCILLVYRYTVYIDGETICVYHKDFTFSKDMT